MKNTMRLILDFLRLLLKSRNSLILENTLLRQQLNIYKRQNKRPKLKNSDRMILSFLCKLFSRWKGALVIVQPETVIKWHRKGFKYYWRRKSRPSGRPNIDWKLIKLIRMLQKENPLWSAQRIQGELAKLGYSVCDNTVLKYMKKPSSAPDKRQRWRTFLKNHAKQIVAIDFMVVRTLFFKAIYVYVAISHDRRKILHFGVASKPHSQWAIQQLRETLAYDNTAKYLIRDNDGIFSWDFKRAAARMGLQDTPTAPHSPWQNPIAERVIGTLRRECLDHIIVLNEKHLQTVLDEFIEYYNDSRTHLSLNKDAPACRAKQADGKIVSNPVLGGLHHIYSRVA